MHQISPRQLADWISDQQRDPPVLLDVREPWEYELCHLPHSQHLPMHLVPARLGEIGNPAADVVVICHHGGRSMQVALFLERNGFSAVHNLSGGVDAWAQVVDPSLRRY